jgi:adenylate cyclase
MSRMADGEEREMADMRRREAAAAGDEQGRATHPAAGHDRGSATHPDAGHEQGSATQPSAAPERATGYGAERAEERRLVTVLFADLVGFTKLGDESDPEEVRAVQLRYFELVSQEVARFGGSVEKYIGDAVVAVFGLPRAHDDDAERAVRAALAIRARVPPLDLEVRIGVNTGEVVGGLNDPRGGLSLAGDAINVAARLQQAAEPGAILVGATTRRLTEADFEYGDHFELAVKGKAQPVRAASLLDVRQRGIRVRPGAGELVGRGPELQALQASLSEATAGRGRVVALIGEAGIGKSRLAFELRHAATALGSQVIWVAARSYASGEPYFLVTALIRELLGEDRERALATLDDIGAQQGVPPGAVDRWRSALHDLIGGLSADPTSAPGWAVDVTPQGRQRAVADALGALVAGRAAATPLVIVLDDLHWVDPASLAILDDLVDLIADLPVLVLATARPSVSTGWPAKRHYRQVNLDSLAHADALRLAEQLSGGESLRAELAAELLERSGGNPFFLEELVASALAGDRSAERLPETVQEVVLARIDSLPAEPRRVLQLASVVGMEFSVDLIEVLDPQPNLDAALDALRRDDLVLRRPAADDAALYVFRHPLIQEVAYRSLLLATRRQLHGRLARHLEAQGREEQIPAMAVHYRASDDLEHARRALVKAAERADRLYATREASHFWQDAAALADESAERARLLERAAFEAYQSGDLERSIALHHETIEAYEHSGDALRALDVRRMLSRVHWGAGNRRESEESIAQAIDGLERLTAGPELALAYSYRSQLLMLEPNPEASVRNADRAIELAEAVGARYVLAHAYTNRGASRYTLGDPGGIDDMRMGLALALELDRPDDAARAYTNLSPHGQLISSQPAAATNALVDEGIAYASEKLPGGLYEQALRLARLEQQIVTARWSVADRELRAFRHMARYGVLMLTSSRALLAAYRGDGSGALEHALDDLRQVEEIGELQLVVPRYAALLAAHGADGRFAQAAESFERLLELVGERRNGALVAYVCFEAVDVAVAAFGESNHEPVARLVRALERLTGQHLDDLRNAPTEADRSVRSALVGASLATAAQLAGRLGIAPDRLIELHAGLPEPDAARAALEASGWRFHAARIALWRAELEASGPAATIVEVFEKLGAAAHLRRARQQQKEGGIA